MQRSKKYFRENSIQALQDPNLRRAMRMAVELFNEKRGTGLSSVPFQEWRDQASIVRSKCLSNLQNLVDTFAANATKAGAIVSRAPNAENARSMILDILKDNRAGKVIKAKSMVTEEIELNYFLDEHGVEVTETDLGEFIIQLANERPSHILGPAIHKNRTQVGKLFAEKLGTDFSDDPEKLVKVAKNYLRTKFLEADAGITGANFAVCENGSLAIVSNEGNVRMSTALPSLHIAVLTIEKVIPTLQNLSLLVRLLPRVAVGQPLSSYVSIVSGPQKNVDLPGPKRMHIILLDNGRKEILRGVFSEILKCIRCSACLNVCPVYGTVGGHAYDSTYPGPMGIVLTNLLNGMESAYPLLDACSLCGACGEICPVKIPLPKLILALRELRTDRGYNPVLESVGMSVFGVSTKNAAVFQMGQKILKTFWSTLSISKKNFLFSRIPRPASVCFRGKDVGSK